MRDTLPSAVQSRAAKILLVDDDAISLEILALMLGHDGHEVVRASDGEAALSLLACPDSGICPDVLLVDLQMPGISGGELVEKVRAIQGSQPVMLAMSATAVDAQRLRGFDGFLLKPLTIDDLRRALKSAANKTAPVKSNGRGPNARPRTTQRQSLASKDEIIDRAVLSKLGNAMPAESLKELYQACLDDSRQRVLGLQALARTGRLAEIPRGAHQVKGAASMVGAVRLARLAAALELGSCKEEATLRLLDDLLDACDELQRMLLAGKLNRANDDSHR